MTSTDTQFKNLLFIDIETVSGVSSFEELSERFKAQWIRKAQTLKSGKELCEKELYFQKAAIYAEFGKIIVIGLGFFHRDSNDQLTLRTRIIQGHDEKEVLLEFIRLLEKKYPKKLALCAHNGREFDYPYLCRRILVNGLRIPKSLWNPTWKKYEIPHLDTMDMWKFGDYKSFTSLELLAALFDIPSSKQNMSGDQVNAAYYLRNQLEEIAHYCHEDVIVLAQLFLRHQQLPLIHEECIVRVD
ncbi:MAG: 3'-5' exonuclease [Siphonobacter sp.]